MLSEIKSTFSIRQTGTLLAALMVLVSMSAMPVSAAEGDLEITVEDADGNAIEGATVTVTDPADGSEVASQDTDTSGLASFTGVGAAGEDYDVSVSHADYDDASATITLDSGATTTSTISLTESTDSGSETEEIKYEVTDSNGDSVEGATVTVDGVEATTDADGVAVFDATAINEDADPSVTHADYNDSELTVEQVNDGWIGGVGGDSISTDQIVLIAALITILGFVGGVAALAAKN